jgi:hypothetical protein
VPDTATARKGDDQIGLAFASVEAVQFRVSENGVAKFATGANEHIQSFCPSGNDDGIRDKRPIHQASSGACGSRTAIGAALATFQKTDVLTASCPRILAEGVSPHIVLIYLFFLSFSTHYPRQYPHSKTSYQIHQER